jgi:hypothetical protein
VVGSSVRTAGEGAGFTTVEDKREEERALADENWIPPYRPPALPAMVVGGCGRLWMFVCHYLVEQITRQTDAVKLLLRRDWRTLSLPICPLLHHRLVVLVIRISALRPPPSSLQREHTREGHAADQIVRREFQGRSPQ